MAFLMLSGISAISFSLARGRMISKMPARSAASSFSLSPPMASTLPLSVISPVMAISRRTGILAKALARAVRVGTPGWVFVVWIFGGLLTLAGALSYAELAAAIPEAGGEYAYLREAYGPLWGFLYSWTQMWVAKSGSIATLATGFFYYLTTFFPSLDRVIYSIPLPIGPHGGPLEIRFGQLFAMALILALAWLNYYGVKLGGNVQVAVTITKVALIAFVIFAGLVFGGAVHHAPQIGRASCRER